MGEKWRLMLGSLEKVAAPNKVQTIGPGGIIIEQGPHEKKVRMGLRMLPAIGATAGIGAAVMGRKKGIALPWGRILEGAAIGGTVGYVPSIYLDAYDAGKFFAHERKHDKRASMLLGRSIIGMPIIKSASDPRQRLIVNAIEEVADLSIRFSRGSRDDHEPAPAFKPRTRLQRGLMRRSA